MRMFGYFFRCKKGKAFQIFTISVEMRELQPFHWSPNKIRAKTFFLVALKKSNLNTLF